MHLYLVSFGLLAFLATYSSAGLSNRAFREQNKYQRRNFVGKSFDSESDEMVRFNRRNNYGATCRDYSLEGTILKARCQKIDGEWISTEIDLEPIVGNTNGQLTMRRRALTPEELAEEKRQMQKREHYTSGYANSCDNLSLSGTELSGNCKDYNGTPHPTTIDLNNRISNIDGHLRLDQ